MELSVIRQINGDMRIDDAVEDAPMLKIEFFDKFAELEDSEKDQIMNAVTKTLAEIFVARFDVIEAHARGDQLIRRREAIEATKEKRDGRESA